MFLFYGAFVVDCFLALVALNVDMLLEVTGLTWCRKFNGLQYLTIAVNILRRNFPQFILLSFMSAVKYLLQGWYYNQN